MRCMKNSWLCIFFFIFASMVLTCCYQPKEGCLDIYATNFDVTADNNCCCKYPVIQIGFTHKINDQAFNSSDTIVNDLGQSFKINDFSFYFSNFRFTGNTSADLSTQDTLHLPGDNTTIILKNDLLLVRSATSSLTTGRLIQKEDFSKVKLKVGVPDEANAVSFSSVPSSSILSRQPDSLFTPDVGYLSFRYSFTNGVGQGSSERIIRVFEDVDLSFDIIIPLKLAFNLCMDMVIDHKQVFHNIDVINDSDEVVKNKLIQNLSNAIVLKACQ